MNATHTNRLAGLLSNPLRQPTFGGAVAPRAEATTHWLRRFLDLLMRTLAVPAI
jgi:hypothetical protein